MENKVLITGASVGVGLSLTKFLVNNGFTVITISRRKDMAKQKIASKNIISYGCDLTDLDDLQRLIKDDILKEHKYIPFLINNAGSNIKKEFMNISMDEFNYLYSLNTFAPSLLIQTLLPKMLEKNFGRIINITSGAPLDPNNNSSVFASSKAALNSITIAVANEYKNHNIKINLMSPGPVKSEMEPDAPFDPSICHETLEYLLLLDKEGPTGKFFWLGYEIPLHPNLNGIKWLEGKATEKYKRIR